MPAVEGGRLPHQCDPNMVQCLLWKGCGRWPSSSPVLFNGKWSSSPRSGHSRVGSKNPLTAIGLDYGDHSAAHVPSPLGALESSISRTCLVCVMCGRVRFFAQWERVTAAVAAPRRFLLSVCVSYGSSISAVPSASLKCSHGEESNREKDSAVASSLSPVASTIAGTFRCPASVR